jgi:hypothetical protein
MHNALSNISGEKDERLCCYHTKINEQEIENASASIAV